MKDVYKTTGEPLVVTECVLWFLPLFELYVDKVIV